jgi:hypothetical protein
MQWIEEQDAKLVLAEMLETLARTFARHITATGRRRFAWAGDRALLAFDDFRSVRLAILPWLECREPD